MSIIPLNHVRARGEIAARATLLYARLEGTMYRPDTIFTIESGGWPGDWEGRTILALTMLAQTTGKEPAYLDEIVERLGENCNEKGYMRQILADGDVDEQQLSGHSWLLRGLCEYFLYRREDKERSAPVLARIEAIVENLFLNAAGRYAEYPICPKNRVQDGRESGHIGRKAGHWYLSSDTGCAFIPLDGVSHAYVLLDRYSADRELVSRVKSLLDEMVANFYTIPFLKISVQTHATLTGCRGLLRLYEQDKDPEKLTFAEKIFALYRKEGMTANYANYNWFGRPEWTEPCAVIDSFMLAAQLFAHTGNMEYAELAQKILYNGLYAGQRANGGFGTDLCCGAEGREESDLLACSAYEAYWCCSMRGGEGLACVSRYSVMETGEDSVFMLYPADGIYTVHGVKLLVRSSYPMLGETRIRVLDNPGRKTLRFAVLLADTIHSFELCTGESKWTYVPDLHTEIPEGNNHIKKSLLFCGNMILGTENISAGLPAESADLEKTGLYSWTAPDGTVFEPIMNRYLGSQEEIQSKKIKLLF